MADQTGTVNIRLPKELLKWLKHEAVEREVQVSEVASDAIAAYRDQVQVMTDVPAAS